MHTDADQLSDAGGKRGKLAAPRRRSGTDDFRFRPGQCLQARKMASQSTAKRLKSLQITLPFSVIQVWNDLEIGQVVKLPATDDSGKCSHFGFAGVCSGGGGERRGVGTRAWWCWLGGLPAALRPPSAHTEPPHSPRLPLLDMNGGR